MLARKHLFSPFKNALIINDLEIEVLSFDKFRFIFIFSLPETIMNSNDDSWSDGDEFMDFPKNKSKYPFSDNYSFHC